MNQSNLSEDKALFFQRVLSDYLLLREAAKEELSILDANRVGVEKNLSNILQQTASHVGLKLPTGYDDSVRDPFDNRKKD